MFMYFYRELRSNFYRRMLEFTYCLKVESKSTETVANCDETSGSADGFKSVWTDQLFAKDLHVYLFKRYYDLQLHSVLYMSKEVAHNHWKSLNFCEFGVLFWKLWKVKSLDSKFLIRLTLYLIFWYGKHKRTLRLIAIFHVWTKSKAFGFNFLSLNIIIIDETVEFNAIKKLWISTLEENSP